MSRTNPALWAIRLVLDAPDAVRVRYWTGNAWTTDPEMALGLTPTTAARGCINLAQSLSGLGFIGWIARVAADSPDLADAIGRGALPVTS